MTEIRALLLTDVVGSTRLSERLGDVAMADVWATHDRAARDLLPLHGGREIDKTDGMLLMFSRAADAVAYAQAYHRALADLPVPLQACAGLHVGAVLLRENSAADVARGATPLEVGGLGKTRLSLQVASETLHAYPDGAWFVDLMAVRDPAMVVSETARALDITDEPGRPLIDTLCVQLRHRRTLLVFDNCEHLVEPAGALVHALLKAVPQLKVLASSRELLDVPGEQSVPVQLLPLPNRGDGVQALQQSTAARLFLDRVLAHRPDYVLNDADAADVADLVVRLEGIPLAIELAAARMRTLDVAEINEGLRRRFEMLTGGSRRLQARQQTLRGLVDWSYDMLATPERTVFDRLAVFVGGFDAEAALAVCVADPVSGDAVPALVQSLVDKSLVMRETTPDGERLRMLDTLRDYAAEKLQAAPDAPAVAARHCEHFFAVSRDGSRGLQGADPPKWLRRFEADTPRHPPRAARPLRCRGRDGPGRRLSGRAGWALRHGAGAPSQRRSRSGRLIHAGEAIEGSSWPQRRAVVTDVRRWLACARAGRHAACNLGGRSPAACGNPSYRDNAWMCGQWPPRAHQPPST